MGVRRPPAANRKAREQLRQRLGTLLLYIAVASLVTRCQ